MTLFVETPALMTTIQDWGRVNYERFGMPGSGPMDWWAFQIANMLVGNTVQQACVEIGFSSAAVVVEQDALLAVCGTGYDLSLNGQEIPLWMAFLARRGDRVVLTKTGGGNWVYLAAAGGINSEMWMGSRSVYLRGGLGRMLIQGDRLSTDPISAQSRMLAGSSISTSARPSYRQNPVVRVITGPHANRFREESFDVFWSQPFVVSVNSDRMGYRLTGPSLAHTAGADLISQGMALGEIQVPADGQPIVMMPDHPTTGGYTCIGTVARVDLPLLAQAQPLKSQLHFSAISVEEAQQLLFSTIHKIDSGIHQEEELWQNL